MASVSFGTFSKRRNSTKQPASLSDTRTVTLKETTSQDRPTFIVTGNNFDYNYCMWNNKYYFIEDIESLHNNMIAVHCVLDPLATYKSEILASTQFVSYSNVSGGNWLADNRIPILKNATVATAASTLNFLFTDVGFYVLSAVGQDGCNTFILDSTMLDSLLNDVSSWTSDLQTDLYTNLPYPSPSDETEALSNLYSSLIRTGTLGNAYTDAPSCIRSCIWVPFFASFFTGNSETIYLGQYETPVQTYKCKTTPVSRTASVTIPWQFSDWRRSVCEEVYLYIPLVGMVSIPSDEIVNETTINITWSATATDGCIAYLVTAGNQVIGTYGASCAVNYPIGISQQASAGEIVQTAIPAIQRTVSGGIQGFASGGIGGAALGIAGNAAVGAYETLDVALSHHNSCIGGIGGGAGCGLSLDLKCFTVAHDTVITPANMQATMGVPTMKPLTLSSCSGFCQCANAHVEAPATAQELDAIDAYLNSGFYIE